MVLAPTSVFVPSESLSSLCVSQWTPDHYRPVSLSPFNTVHNINVYIDDVTKFTALCGSHLCLLIIPSNVFLYPATTIGSKLVGCELSEEIFRPCPCGIQWTLASVIVTLSIFDDIQTHNCGERTEQSQDGSRDFRRCLRVYNVRVCVCRKRPCREGVGGGGGEGGSDRWFPCFRGDERSEGHGTTKRDEMDGEKEGRERLFLSPLYVRSSLLSFFHSLSHNLFLSLSPTISDSPSNKSLSLSLSHYLFFSLLPISPSLSPLLPLSLSRYLFPAISLFPSVALCVSI